MEPVFQKLFMANWQSGQVMVLLSRRIVVCILPGDPIVVGVLTHTVLHLSHMTASVPAVVGAVDWQDGRIVTRPKLEARMRRRVFSFIFGLCLELAVCRYDRMAEVYPMRGRMGAGDHGWWLCGLTAPFRTLCWL